MTNTQVQDMKRYLKSYQMLRREESLQRMRLAELERRIRLPILYSWKEEPMDLKTLAEQCRQELLDLMKITLERCREIEALIGQVKGTEEDKTWLYRQILQLHYLDGLFFSEIADRLHYHERHVRRLHREALEAAVGLWEGGEAHGVE